MDLDKIANIGEIVGAITVVVSLVYLAVQIRQGTEAQRTENYSRALDRISAMQSAIGRDSELATMLSKGVTDISLLSPQERMQFTWAFYEVFGAFEFMFYASRSDSIPGEVWQRWSAAIAWWLTFPGVRDWWHAKPTPFTASFTSFVDSLVENNPTDPQATRRYQEFVAGGISRGGVVEP